MSTPTPTTPPETRSVDSSSRRRGGRGRAGPSLVSRRRRTTAIAGILFVAPAAIYILVVFVGPVIYGLGLSFTDYNPMSRGGPEWHGLDGYRAVLTSGRFWSAIGVTVYYAIGTLALAVPISLGVAVLVNRSVPGITLFRSIIFAPRVVSLVSVSMIWLWLYSRDGFFNYLLDLVGLQPVNWLNDPDLTIWSLIVMRSWKALGGNMILFLAALQQVPLTLHEAARVDGAGRWQAFRHVTLPAIRPMTTYVVATNLIFLAQSFSEIFILTGGGPLETTTVVNMLIYTEAFQYNRLGHASAMAFVLFTLIFALAYFNVRVMTRRSEPTP